MATSSRQTVCVLSTESFCYVCGHYWKDGALRPICNNVRKYYAAYFGIPIKTKPWAPSVVCTSCRVTLQQWATKKRSRMPFGEPMKWCEPSNHRTDCYFCVTNINGMNSKNRATWKYPDLPSARLPRPHSDDVPVPVYVEEVVEPSGMEVDPPPLSGETTPESDDFFLAEAAPKKFTQQELNDLIRDLRLPKDSSELLASRLKEKNLLTEGTKVTFYRRRDEELLRYFGTSPDLVYCKDVPNLLKHMGHPEYVASEWRLFLDSSKRSLKAVLLHNGNRFASIPLGHSTRLQENYAAVRYTLEKINYAEHQWPICVDLKMVTILLGQQSGYTKHPCFLCLWDSRADGEHWTRTSWPSRELVVGRHNVINDALVPISRIILPPLHIKLGLIKQFVKALNKDGRCFAYIVRKLHSVSIQKLRAGVLDGPQIRKLINDPDFIDSMDHTERDAWRSFVLVVQNFLGNTRAENYKELVQNMLTSFRSLGCRMSIKVHFLHGHLDWFPENLGAMSDEQGERFHQDISTMEQRYQGRWDDHMMADYCWNLIRDQPESQHSRQSLTKKFLPGDSFS